MWVCRGGGSIDTQLGSCHFLGGEGRGGREGGGVDRHSLWKWSWDYLADLGWIDIDPGGGVDWHSLWKWSWDYLADPGWINTDPAGGSIDTQLGKDLQRLWKDRLNLERIRKTLEGLPQLGKDLQRPWKDRLNVERIRNVFGRITSTWKGSTMTLEGLPELGKDLQWLWKDCLCQCWSWGDWGDFESEVGITLQIRGRLTLTLKVKLGLPCGSGVDRHWSWGGVDRHSLWKWSRDYLADLGWINTDPWGGWSTLILKVK